jgi:hypothetical protein
MNDKKFRVNVNTNVAAKDRRKKIQVLGADATTMARLEEFCQYDNELWSLFVNKPHSV